MAERSEATQILQASMAGNQQAQARLLELIYDDLHNLAEKQMRGERPDHTLQTTALVHEAYMRLVDYDQMDWQGRSHFLAMAATTLRRVLVDHARAKRAQKRGGDAQQVTWTGQEDPELQDPLDLLALDEALEKLAEKHPLAARVVDLRFFGGLGVKEVAHALRVPRDTVKGYWKFARAWLNRELTRGGAAD